MTEQYESFPEKGHGVRESTDTYGSGSSIMDNRYRISPASIASNPASQNQSLRKGFDHREFIDAAMVIAAITGVNLSPAGSIFAKKLETLFELPWSH